MKLHEWEVDWLFDWKFDGIYLVRSPHQNYHPSDLSRRSSPCLSDHTHRPHPESSHVHPPNDSHRHSYRRKMLRFVVEGWWGMPSGWQRVGYGDGFRGCVRGCTRGNLVIRGWGTLSKGFDHRGHQESDTTIGNMIKHTSPNHQPTISQSSSQHDEKKSALPVLNP